VEGMPQTSGQSPREHLATVPIRCVILCETCTLSEPPLYHSGQRIGKRSVCREPRSQSDPGVGLTAVLSTTHQPGAFRLQTQAR
jgi:hypothetical protein